MPDERLARLTKWARENWPGMACSGLEAVPFPADGSPRLFARISCRNRSLVGLYSPDNAPENRAWHYLARHLRGLGLPVARVLAADEECGLFLMADLGQTSLQEKALAADSAKSRAGLYEPVLAMLARMQATAVQGFDTSICFDGPELDPEFLRRREAGYFLGQFVLGALGLNPDRLPAGLEADLDLICRRAGEAAPRGFVHRDFQSRNIIVDQGRLGLVDFQGARLGPAQYDLASLLHDPYVDLADELRQELLEHYLELRGELGPFDRAAFLEGWPFVSLCRVMQALGAYAYLSRELGKRRFAPYAAPALKTLRRLAALPALEGCAGLRELLSMLPQEPPLAAFTPRGEKRL